MYQLIFLLSDGSSSCSKLFVSIYLFSTLGKIGNWHTVNHLDTNLPRPYPHNNFFAKTISFCRLPAILVKFKLLTPLQGVCLSLKDIYYSFKNNCNIY